MVITCRSEFQLGVRDISCLSAGNTSPHAQLRMGVNLRLGRQAPIPQDDLCFHPKNTANTHISDPRRPVSVSAGGTKNSVLKELGGSFC